MGDLDSGLLDGTIRQFLQIHQPAETNRGFWGDCGVWEVVFAWVEVEGRAGSQMPGLALISVGSQVTFSCALDDVGAPTRRC